MAGSSGTAKGKSGATKLKTNKPTNTKYERKVAERMRYGLPQFA